MGKKTRLIKSLFSKSTPENTAQGSIQDGSLTSRNSENLEKTASSSNVEPNVPQAEGSSTLMPREGQVSETLNATVTDSVVEAPTESEATTSGTRDNKAAPAPSPAPKSELEILPVEVTSNLWDEAYDILKAEDPNQMDQYERILTLWIQSGRSKSTPRRPSMSRRLENHIDPSDRMKRREQMSMVVRSCFGTTGRDQSSDDESSDNESSDNESSDGESSDDEGSKDESKATDTKWLHTALREIIRSTAPGIPDTSLLWAGACLSIQVSKRTFSFLCIVDTSNNLVK
ncbi:MAG: hypothetical protein Q9190_004552 [Brigantiaea leucoxantha]